MPMPLTLTFFCGEVVDNGSQVGMFDTLHSTSVRRTQALICRSAAGHVIVGATTDTGRSECVHGKYEPVASVIALEYLRPTPGLPHLYNTDSCVISDIIYSPCLPVTWHARYQIDSGYSNVYILTELDMSELLLLGENNNLPQCCSCAVINADDVTVRHSFVVIG